MGKLFIYVQTSFSPNLRLLEWEIRELWIITKKTLGDCVSRRASKTKD